MSVYRVAYSKAAFKGLKRVPAQDRRRMIDKIHTLAAAPKTSHTFASRLVGRPETRVRQGDWRALVRIDHSTGSLTVIAVAHRREVYE